MLTGTNILYTKQYNLRIVHEVIRLYGPLSRAEIARHTELTGQTISNLVKELISLGLIVEAQRRQEGRGAPSIALAINPDAAYAIGLDLDRDHLSGVLVDLAGRVRQRIFLGLNFPTPQQALDIMVSAVETLVARQGLALEDILGLGVGISGPMYHGADGRDYVANPKAVPGWQNIPIATWLRERLGLPVFLENNATAAAVGERWYGAGRQIKSFFYIYFGSGLGGGLVLDGRPVSRIHGQCGRGGVPPADGWRARNRGRR
jgi:predicted NBD/HSP70 family sugar kinase